MSAIHHASVVSLVQRFLGLSPAILDLSLTGAFEGVPVQLQPSGNNSASLTMVAHRPRGSDLGLRVFSSSMFRSAERFATGDDAFDGIFGRDCAPGCEPEAPSLLTSDVRAALRAMSVAGSVELYDDCVFAYCQPSTLSQEELDSMFRSLIAAVRASDEATLALDAPLALRSMGASAALEAFARERALSVARHPFALSGAIDHDQFALRFCCQYEGRRGGDPLHGGALEPGFDVRVRFAEPLRGGLSVRPASMLDRAQALVGFGDIETGDRGFDRACTIGTRVENDPDRSIATQLVREQLNERARARLTALAAAGVVLSLDDRSLVARGPLVIEPRALIELVSNVASLRSAMRVEAPRSAYR